MTYPVNLQLLRDVNHMPALPVLERSMHRPDLRLHDFCIPVNAYFPSAAILEGLGARLADILRYYPADNFAIAETLADFLQLDPSRLVVANGSTELITWINERYVRGSLVTDVPTFGRWTDNPREQGREVLAFLRRREDDFRLDVDEFAHFALKHDGRERASALAICNPNNPTGDLIERADMQRLLDQLRSLDVVIVDESFLDFAREDDIPSVAELVDEYDNVIVIKSLGKNLGLHGLRCGYAVTNARLAAELRRMLPPWNVNSLAEAFIRLLAGHRADYEAARRRTVRDVREFASRLARLPGLTAFPPHANFVFAELATGISGVELRDLLLLQSGCFVRECGSKLGANSRYLRIASRPPDEQRVLLVALAAVLETAACATSLH